MTFPARSGGKGIPYGVYDITNNHGCVSVGTDHDTSQFAVNTIRQWCYQMGKEAYPQAELLLAPMLGSDTTNGENDHFHVKLAIKYIILVHCCPGNFLRIAITNYINT